jgi:hypothetical protein
VLRGSGGQVDAGLALLVTDDRLCVGRATASCLNPLMALATPSDEQRAAMQLTRRPRATSSALPTRRSRRPSPGYSMPNLNNANPGCDAELKWLNNLLVKSNWSMIYTQRCSTFSYPLTEYSLSNARSGR